MEPISNEKPSAYADRLGNIYSKLGTDVGICALLNSTLFDNYFRTFNGNINVSATEVREIPLPPLKI